MKDMRLLRDAAAVILVLHLGACAGPTEFIAPLSEPGTTQIDKRLVGTWYGLTYPEGPRGESGKCTKEDQRPTQLTTLHIAAKPGDTELLVRASILALDTGSPYQDGKRRGRDFGRALQIEATAFPAEVDGITYYNIKRHPGIGYDYTGAGEQPHYILAQLEHHDPDTFSLRFVGGSEIPEEVLGELGPDGRFSVNDSRFIKVSDRESFLGYGIFDVSREIIVANLREGDLDNSVTYGPFHRLKPGSDMSGEETLACQPIRVRQWRRLHSLAEAALGLAKAGLEAQAQESASLALDMIPKGPASVNGYADVLMTLAEAQAVAGDLPGARATVSRLPPGNDLGWLRYWVAGLVRTLILVGKIPDAIDLVMDLVKSTEDLAARGDSLGYIAAAQANEGDLPGAMQTARLASSLSELVRIAELLSNAGRADVAKVLLGQANNQFELDVGDLYYLSGRQFGLGLREDARDSLRQAVALEEQAISRTLADKPDQGQPSQAWLDRMTNHVQRLVGAAYRQATLEMLEDARQSLRSALSLATAAGIPRDAFMHEMRPFVILWLQVKLGDMEEARRTLEEAIAIDPSALGRAHAYVAFGDVRKGISMIEGNPKMLYELAGPFAELEPRDLAIQRDILDHAFLAAKAAHPLYDRHHDAKRKAILHAEVGQHEAAAYFLAMAIDIAGDYDRLYWLKYESDARVHALLEISATQNRLGDRGGARTSALYAFAIARDIPELEPCDRGPILLLDLPELQMRSTQ